MPRGGELKQVIISKWLVILIQVAIVLPFAVTCFFFTGLWNLWIAPIPNAEPVIITVSVATSLIGLIMTFMLPTSDR